MIFSIPFFCPYTIGIRAMFATFVRFLAFESHDFVLDCSQHCVTRRNAEMSDEWSAIAKVVEEKKKKSGHAWSATATVCGYTLWGKKTTEETKKQKKMKKQQEEARSKAPFGKFHDVRRN